MSASEIIACTIGGCVLVVALLAWCEPEPARDPDSIVCDEAWR
jgi:hypothetical protein